MRTLTMPSVPGFDFSKLDLSKLQLPKFDLPKFDLPRFSLPTFDMPKFSLPKVDLPKVDLPKVDVDRLGDVARDAAYVGVGLVALDGPEARRASARDPGRGHHSRPSIGRRRRLINSPPLGGQRVTRVPRVT